jgi:hypothetical protein
MNTVHDCISYSTIPLTNPTKPSAPGFALTPLLGTLRFNFTDPITKPLQTRYQVLRSPGTLAVAGSYSVIWEGVADEIALPADPRSMFWYHGRAVANSFYSTVSPNTFGLGTAPWIGPESVPGNRSYPDGELAFAISSYWSFVDSAAVSGIPSSLSFSTANGFTAQRGYVRVSVSSNNNGGTQTYLSPMRFDTNSRFSLNAVPMLSGQRGVAYLTMRGPGSSSLPGIAFSVFASRVESPGVGYGVGGTPLVTQTIDQRAVASGTWVTYISTFTLTGSFYDGAAAAVIVPPAYGGAVTRFDVGALQLTVL